MITIRCTRSRGPRGFFCLQVFRRGPVNVAVILRSYRAPTCWWHATNCGQQRKGMRPLQRTCSKAVADTMAASTCSTNPIAALWFGQVRSDTRSTCSNHAAEHARLRLADSLELEHGPGPLQDNKTLNRSGDGFVVGTSPDGRRLPLYPTPFSLIYVFRSARLTRTLSRLNARAQ
ncbi:hypothetical protein MFFC18_25930 [Mariniblastus fucicola]|uniref:Uncharacterized protein n=1 Tax=Mariniblastus fucicola TaxID=980251 RepID=A0A5B9PCC7_9BACT|nr:hypothetical protein MFFC18_25930 [Mariniblastus fucicola]